MSISYNLIFVKIFPVWLQNRLIFAGLELVFSHTEKSCIELYPVFYEYKTGFNLIIGHFIYVEKR